MGNDLESIIRQEIQENGPIPFSRYMEICLYHPEQGYYQRRPAVTGKTGDFFTAPHVHELFGHTVSAWIRAEAAKMGVEEMTLIELGPGNGQLAQDILDSWDSSGPSLSMILVEASDPGKKKLEARFRERPVRVLSPPQVDDVDPVIGVVIANEFFDALPLRIFENRDGIVHEVHVEVGEDSLEEVLFPAKDLPESYSFLLSDLHDGFRTEISPGWETWMEKVARVLEKGCLLVVDYGEFTDGLLVPWRMGGTMRCFHRHQVDADPYEAPGEKDITAHVNFSLIKEMGLSRGFSLRSYTTQSSFLIKGGILELIAQRMNRLGEREGMKLWLTVKNLVHDEGMGEIFKAMVLEKKTVQSPETSVQSDVNR